MKLLLSLLLACAIYYSTTLMASPNNPYLPNASLTPGAINTAITQENIQKTICVHNFTSTERPPIAYTTKLKRVQIGQYNNNDIILNHYEEDHLISLELGGNPTNPRNLWPESYATNCGAKTKDNIENRLHMLVCSYKITLKQAQDEISTDWIKSYNDHIGILVCKN